jgi:hypothetical protein
MMKRRDFLLATAVSAISTVAAPADEPRQRANLGLLLYSYGLRGKAEKDRGFADPVRFLEFARQRGASAIQLPLGVRPEPECALIRQASDRLQMSVEGIVSPPKEDPSDVERFTRELETARQCGATILRVVLLGGRRYEVFNEAAEFPAFAERSQKVLQRAEKIARDC